jgi:hypothetical protein
MSILGDIGKVAGGVLGNSVVPGLGGMVGSALGGIVGDKLQDLAGGALNEFQKDPLGALANPQGFAAKYADSVLKDMGIPAPFRNLAQFAIDPKASILDQLHLTDPPTCGCRGPNGAPHNGDLKTNGNDVVDTGRYLISAKENELKIYDKQTNTWVKCEGDPHGSTSDGDKFQFHDNATITLPDGSAVKIKTTPKDCNGVAYIDKVAVLKGDEAVVMSGFHDGRAGVNMGEVFHNANEVDNMWKDGTVLRAGNQVDDLSYQVGGKEIKGSDPSQRWGEINIDGHGGKYEPGDSTCPKWPLPLPFPKLPLPFPFPKNPGPIPFPFPKLPNFPNLPGPIPFPKLPDFPKLPFPFPGNGGGTTPTPGHGGCDKPGGTTGTGGTSGGGSIFEKIFAILQKLQDQLNQKVKDLDGLDPNQDKAALDKGLFEVQQLQQQMTQLTSMATNLSSADHNSKKGIVDNFNIR